MLRSLLLFETPEQIFLRVFAELKPRTQTPAIRIGFCRFANATASSGSSLGLWSVRITDVLEGAPAVILEALAHPARQTDLETGCARLRERYRRYLTAKR